MSVKTDVRIHQWRQFQVFLFLNKKLVFVLKLLTRVFLPLNIDQIKFHLEILLNILLENFHVNFKY